jgi:hypothetical protein
MRAQSESRSHQNDNASNDPTGGLIMGLCLLKQRVVRVNATNIWIYYQYCLVEDVFNKYTMTVLLRTYISAARAILSFVFSPLLVMLLMMYNTHTYLSMAGR